MQLDCQRRQGEYYCLGWDVCGEAAVKMVQHMQKEQCLSSVRLPYCTVHDYATYMDSE